MSSIHHNTDRCDRGRSSQRITGRCARLTGSWASLRRLPAIVGLVLGLFLLGAAGASAQPAFSLVPGSPFTTGGFSDSVAFNASGELLATADANLNENDATVSLFSVSPNGTLAAAPGSPFPAPGAVDVAFSPTSDGLLATTNAQGLGPPISDPNTVSVFTVGPDDALTQVPGSPFPTGSGPGVLSGPGGLAFSPSGGLLATANGDGTVSVFSVASDGSLTQVPGSPFSTGYLTSPESVAFSPSGGLLAAANGVFSNTVSVFSVGSDGSLTQVPGSPFATGDQPGSVAFSPKFPPQ